MNNYLIQHIKHVIITVLIVASGLYGLISYEKYKERLADKTQVLTDQILKNKNEEQGKNDKQFSDFKTDMLRQMDGIKTAKQGTTVLQPIMMGATPQGLTKADLPPVLQSQLPADTKSDTHYNLFTDDQVIGLAKSAETCKITERGLTTCETNKLLMQSQMDALTKANNQWKEAGTVPRWTFTLGATKSQTSQYKPAAFLDYRIQHNWGLTAGSANNAIFGGVSIHFGNNPKE